MIPIVELLAAIEQYPVIALIILGFLGTEALLLIMFLAGSQSMQLSFWIVFITGFIIILILDGLYYKIGSLSFLKNITPKKLRKKKYTTLFNYIKKISHDNLFFILLISKFFYGLRQMTVMYFGYNQHPYIKFFKKDALAILIYFSVMMPIVWFLGKGASASFDSVKEIEITIALAVLFLAVFYMAGKFILFKLIKKI